MLSGLYLNWCFRLIELCSWSPGASFLPSEVPVWHESAFLKSTIEVTGYVLLVLTFGMRINKLQGMRTNKVQGLGFVLRNLLSLNPSKVEKDLGGTLGGGGGCGELSGTLRAAGSTSFLL